jgi:hypothetical protein
MNLHPGEIILITSDESDQYQFYGLYRVLAEFDISAVAKRFTERDPLGRHYIWLIARLVEQGLVERVDFREVNLGRYGEMQPQVEDGARICVKE